MFIEEIIIIKNMLKDVKRKKILNVCSSNSIFYQEFQPQIFKEVMLPLIKRGNEIINCNNKKDTSVDIVNDYSDMSEFQNLDFDIVLLNSDIEKITDVGKLLSEIKRILKPNGLLICSALGVYPVLNNQIDTMLRLPKKRSWEILFENQWKILEFKKTKPLSLSNKYYFKPLVFRTVVKAKRNDVINNNSLNDKGLKVDAFVLAYKREGCLKNVINGIRRQKFIRNIYVFHNAPSSKKIKGVINIVSQKNFGFVARYATALSTDCDYAFFVDDDTELLVDFSKRFIEAIKKDSDSIVGFFGSNVDSNASKNKLYFSGGCFIESNFKRYVDIIIGRVFLCKRRLLVNYFSQNDDYKYFMNDDIYFNLICQMKTGKPSVIIPSNNNEYCTLSKAFSFCDKKTHYNNRSLIIYNMIKKGWVTCRTKSSFKKYNEKMVTIEKISKTKIDQFSEKVINEIKNCNLEKAESNARKILKWDPFQNKWLYNVASAYFISEKLISAGKIYNELTIKNNTLISKDIKALSYYKLALIHLKQKKLIKCKKYLKCCLNLMPGHKSAFILLNNQFGILK